MARRGAIRPPPWTLRVVERETWDNGTVVVWLAVPFLVGRKPFVPSRLIGQGGLTRVRLDSLVATQSRVTQTGVQKYLDDPGDEVPLIYQTREGRFIADGHHRAVSYLLRGRRVVDVRLLIVEV